MEVMLGSRRQAGTGGRELERCEEESKEREERVL